MRRGDKRGASRRVARAAAMLFKERSRCAADFLQDGRDTSRLQDCQDTALAMFQVRAAGRCDEKSANARNGKQSSAR